MVTKEEVRRALDVALAVSDAIRELGEVPSGHLYAQLMGIMSLTTYNSIIGMLKRSNLVTESGYLLKWAGPV